MLSKLINNSLRHYYHIRKPRVNTENNQSLINYRKELREARRNNNKEALEYQNMIEDQYLATHAEKMKNKHFNDECNFRSYIAKESVQLQKDIEFWKKEDAKNESRLNKHIHDEDLRRINRERIKKIVTFESENYWYTADNAEERLTEEVFFPGYVASTEYYQRLHAEALVYEKYDFKTLHRLRSNEDVINEKNRILIPIFNTIKHNIKIYKTDKEKHINYESQIAIDQIKLSKTLSEGEKKVLLESEKNKRESALKEYRKQLADPKEKRIIIKRRLKILLSILGFWKRYTNVLGMTSLQILKEIDGAKADNSINMLKKTVMNEVRSTKNTTFVDAVEEDTEEVEISLTDYLAQLRSQKDSQKAGIELSETIHSQELESLISESESSLANQDHSKRLGSDDVKLNLEGLIENQENSIQEDSEDFVSPEVVLSFLNMKETTAGVEMMKEMYKEDKEITTILNQIGEMPVEYPKLFKSIWDSTHSIA